MLAARGALSRPAGGPCRAGAGSESLRGCRRTADARGRRIGLWIAAAGAPWQAGCDGVQSALDPAGRGAESIADLFWCMAAGAALIWLVVVGIAVYVIWIRPGRHRRRTAMLIIGGGAVFPTIVLTVLLGFGLAGLPELLAPAPEGNVTISVTGEQYWWRVRYEGPGGEAVELANEIRLPVGASAEFLLTSADVIHSFWIPPLGGKMDMIPGRVNRIALHPTRTGTFRGACAEYCGASHALMAFPVVVHEGADFEDWLRRQALPADAPATPLAERGLAVFLANGCGACHTIRGTRAKGSVGPDLTHVGGRLSLGAGTLPNEPDDFARWIAQTDEVKPGVHMPSFHMLPAEDLRALAAYLDGLE